MNEDFIPGAQETPDVAQLAEAVEAEKVQNETNYSEMELSELATQFEELAKSEDRMKRSKEADAIKSAFYKKLIKEKVQAGVISESASIKEVAESEKNADAEETDTVQAESADNPFETIEKAFKAFYNAYKKERAEFNKELEKEREDNLKLKQGIIADLKELIDKQGDVNQAFPEFRKIQDRWRAVGQVPATSFRNVNDTYQLYVEQFYDMVNINRELRDLDFKKNLEAKQQFCELAEKLSENENVIDAFKELQKLHEQWKEFGPVAKQYRDEIWDRFKAATAVINKKYQAHFEGMKDQQASNLEAKSKLCELVEAIAEKEITLSNEWNACSKEIEDIQKQWKTIGFASKKDNQKIYERFRAACDKFFERKRLFYVEYKDGMNANYDRKVALCEAAEALKSSTEWKKATDQFINLQKQWKEIGAVPRKKADVLWKRFRAACDEFFEERDKNAKPENDFHNNLKAKQAIIDKINAYVPSDDEDENLDALAGFNAKWQEIGFVPFKEKDRINAEFKKAIAEKFKNASASRRSKFARQPKSEKEKLIQKYSKKEQDIVTYENNIGFFSLSKNAEPLIQQMKERIAQAKEELKELELQIRSLDDESKEQ